MKIEKAANRRFVALNLDYEAPGKTQGNPAEVTIITRDCSDVVPFLFPHLHTICTQVLSKNNN